MKNTTTYYGDGFATWLKRVISRPIYETIPPGATSQYLKGVLLRQENRLRVTRSGRTVSAWLGVIFLGLLALLAYFYLSSKFPLPLWVFYAFSLVLALIVAALGFLFIHFSWKSSIQRGSLIEIRETYKQRVAEELDEDDDEDDARKLLKLHRKYREEAVTVIEDYRAIAKKYKRWHDWFQTIAIIGSVTTSAVTTASVYFPFFRVAAIVISLVVGITTGINGYYKFRERSFNLQQASDLIEREYHSVELRVGRYYNCANEAEAYRLFAQQVETIRDEQNKRQQQLEQPVETKKDDAAYQ